MKTFNYIKVDANESDRIFRITLNRTEKFNALNQEMVEELLAAFYLVGNGKAFSLLLIEAEGYSFCAGDDVQWMKESSEK